MRQLGSAPTLYVIAELKRRNVFRVGAAYLVTAWLIVQVAGTLFPLFGFGDAPARIAVVVLAIGFVPALMCAWIFRLTPAGLEKESETPAPEAGLPRGTQAFDRAVMVVLTLALSYFAFNQFVLDPRRDADMRVRQAAELENARQLGRTQAVIDQYGARSIAVLPFRNTSEDPANEYFSDGISEELLNLLAQVSGLRVISRTSAFSYKDKDVTLARIATDLNVAHVLEGTVRKAGNRVRITAQLIDARSDTQLWSKSWDQTLGDVFAVQEEIAMQVVDELKVQLLGQAPKPVETAPEAYALYLQARYLGRQGTAEGYAQSVELHQRVLDMDPSYVPAWDGLAGNYINQANRGLRAPDAGFALARAASERALGIDPAFAPAHARLGWVAMLADNDLQRAARHYERALELAPTSDQIMGDAASLLKSLGRVDECLALDEYVVTRDPVNTAGHYNLGGSYLYAGRWDEAIGAWETALRLSPGRIGAYYQIGIARLLKGEPNEALAAFDREPLEVLRLLGLVMAHHATGDREQSDRVLGNVVDEYQRDAAYNIAYVMAYRGEIDEAFEWLDRAVEYGDPGLSEIAAEPLFGDMRSDARWLPLLTSLGKAPAQLDAIEFAVTLPNAPVGALR